MKDVFDPREHGDGARQAHRACRQGDDLFDLRGRTSQGKRFSHVGANGPLPLRADGDGELEKPTRLCVERPIRSRQSEFLPRLSNGRVPLNEFLIGVGRPWIHEEPRSRVGVNFGIVYGASARGQTAHFLVPRPTVRQIRTRLAVIAHQKAFRETALGVRSIRDSHVLFCVGRTPPRFPNAGTPFANTPFAN